MLFWGNGFLDEKAEKKAAEIAERNKDLLKFCRDINKYAQKIKFEFEINKPNVQKLTAACLFIKVLEGIQAAIILANRGFTQNTEVLLRVVFEALLLLKNCCEDEDFAVRYIKTDEKRRLKALNVYSKYSDSDESFHRFKGNEAQKLRLELKDRIKNENIEDLSVEELARKVGMSEEYDLHYREFSIPVHSLPRSLERYVTKNESGKISKLIHGPDGKDAPLYLSTLAKYLLIALKSTCLLFDLKEDNVINEFYKRKIKSNNE